MSAVRRVLRLLRLSALVSSTACRGAGPTPPVGPPPEPPPRIRVELTATPLDLTLATLPTLMIDGAVTNLGDRPVETHIWASKMLVDGESSLAWQLAIGNGTRDPRELSLPPGERVEFSRNMGDSLFQTPGDHTLVLRVQGVLSPPVKVHLGR
jgi:hypothetical protein